MSHTRKLVLDTVIVEKMKNESLLALQAYCKSRVFPKPTHYKLAQELMNRISHLTSLAALADALYGSYVVVSRLNSSKLAKALALQLGKLYNIPRLQIIAFQNLASSPTTLLHSEDFTRIYPEIRIQDLNPGYVADPLANARKISASDLPKVKATMLKTRHTSDECSVNHRSNNTNHEVVINLSRTYFDDKSRAVLYVIYDNISIKNPVETAHLNRLKAVQSHAPQPARACPRIK